MTASLDAAVMLCALVFALNFCVEVLVLFDEGPRRLMLVVALGIVLALWAVTEVAMYAHTSPSTRQLLVLVIAQLVVECARLGLLLWAPNSGVSRGNGLEPRAGEVGMLFLPAYTFVFLAILRAMLALRTSELRQMATKDALTGVFNRGHVESCIRGILANRGYPVAMLLIDIDNFKHVNDQHGHRIGDLVLSETTDLLSQNIRVMDTLGRWGGEEFAVLLPDCSASDARHVAEGLRALIANHNFPSVGSVTASFGVAEARPGEEFESWFQRADAALYSAKRAGRNAVILA